MAQTSHRRPTPQRRIEAECDRRGHAEVVATCGQLIRGEGVDPSLLRSLVGPGAEKFLDGEEHTDTYWLRVWGARGLLWAWDGSEVDALAATLTDEAWRVREMGAKVVARHLVVDLLVQVSQLSSDPVPRVRVAANRAVAGITEAGT